MDTLTPPVILDGGLATELERRGHRLTDSLWSARLLRDAPGEIKAVHCSYLESGADIITSASYQASIPGFTQSGMSEAEAISLVQYSVRLAKEAIQERSPGARVAASIGPYGAFLANGSEYTGLYDVGYEDLVQFHRDRWHLLAAENPDLMLCETIPSLDEAKAITDVVSASGDRIPVWMSFVCKNDWQICDGTDIENCARWVDQEETISVIGVNCTSPRFVESLIRRIHSVTSKPIVMFPNSGETYDVNSRSWCGRAQPAGFAHLAPVWRDAGASILGGCCRTTPADIRQLRDAFACPER